jgi:hypothetical protein
MERSIRSLLEPLVRLVIRRDITHGQLSDLLKRVYVDVARGELAVPGERLTISRVAVRTGLTRKEASRLLDEESDHESTARRRIGRAARVLSAWVRESRYADGRGGPISLPFESTSGPSFSELVRLHGADVTPRALLDEMLRVNAVRQLKDGRIRPIERAYVPRADEVQKLEMLGTDVADLIATIDHNITELDREPFYQRKVAYDNLRSDYLPALRALVSERAQDLLEYLDREMSAQDLDLKPSDEAIGGSRAMIGIYYYEENGDDEDAKSS